MFWSQQVNTMKIKLEMGTILLFTGQAKFVLEILDEEIIYL